MIWRMSNPRVSLAVVSAGVVRLEALRFSEFHLSTPLSGAFPRILHRFPVSSAFVCILNSFFKVNKMEEVHT
jgi:hypothetical protein